ncbi:hypothetical protein VR010_14065 [Actinomycetaceae bacterium L2_0104]
MSDNHPVQPRQIWEHNRHEKDPIIVTGITDTDVVHFVFDRPGSWLVGKDTMKMEHLLANYHLAEVSDEVKNSLAKIDMRWIDESLDDGPDNDTTNNEKED